MRPAPEITAVHVLAALSPTAPADVVIALSNDEHRVLVGSAASMRHWRGHLEATLVATRAELASALASGQRDLAAIDAVANTLTGHVASLLAIPTAAA